MSDTCTAAAERAFTEVHERLLIQLAGEHIKSKYAYDRLKELVDLIEVRDRALVAAHEAGKGEDASGKACSHCALGYTKVHQIDGNLYACLEAFPQDMQIAQLTRERDEARAKLAKFESPSEEDVERAAKAMHSNIDAAYTAAKLNNTYFKTPPWEESDAGRQEYWRLQARAALKSLQEGKK